MHFFHQAARHHGAHLQNIKFRRLGFLIYHAGKFHFNIGAHGFFAGLSQGV